MKKWMFFTLIFSFIVIFFSIAVNSKEQLLMQNKDNKMLYDFKDKTVIKKWIPVNDGVMGGVSLGKAEIEDSCLVFSGILSLENNGGFSSIRSKPDFSDLSDYSGIKVKIRGDGRTYQFRIRTDDNFDGVAYRTEFETVKDEWIEVNLPFYKFTPTFRGRTLSNVPPIDASKIKQIGFLIADKQEKEFLLVVDYITAVKKVEE